MSLSRPDSSQRDEQLTVNGLTFLVERSARRKHIGITVERDGSLIVAVPETCELNDVLQVIEDKQLWVHTKLEQKSLYMSVAHSRRFINGEGFYYLGRSYRLLIETSDGHAPLRLHHGRFIIPSDDIPHAREHFIRWYTQHSQTWLWERAGRFTARVGVNLRGIEVGRMAHQWGECLPDSDIRLHWRVILLPPTIIDYILVHELVHLREMNHSPFFWDRISWIIPDYRNRKQWLAENGAAYGL